MSKVKGGSQYQKFGKSHYQRNRQDYIDKAKRRREKNWQYIKDIKKKGKCVDCGIKDYRVLEFDHMPQFPKYKMISKMANEGYSIPKLEEEINKCELRCANCHRVKTYERRQADIA